MRKQVRDIIGFDVSPKLFRLLSAVFFVACSGDCSSSCGGFENRPYPTDRYDETIKLSGQVRVTPTGLDFLEQNLTPLVGQALPDGLSFCLPEDNGDPEICYDNNVCADGANGCQLDLTIDGAKITPQPTDTLKVSVTVGGLDEELSVRFLGSDCLVKMQSPQDSNLPGTITASVPVKFGVDAQSPTKDVRIDVGEVDMNVDGLKLVISGRDFFDNVVCVGASAAASISQVRDLLLGQIQPILQDAVDSALRGQLCMTCDPATPCVANATCQSDGVCEFGDSTCVPRPLGIEGRLLVGDLIADYSETPQAGVDMLVKVADNATVNDGLILGVRSGFQPDEIRRCIPADPTTRPDYAPIPLNPAIVGNVKPDGATFMVGLGYHKKAIQQLLWSVWGSGATCLLIDGDSISSVSLTGGLFTTLLPSLKTIVTSDASVYIKIVPQKTIDVELGANTVTPNGVSYDIDEPLMNIAWKDLDIHIYAYAQERYTRLATLRGDLAVPVAVVFDGMGQIVPVIGDLSNAITNVRPIGGELSAEDPQKLADLLPSLIGSFLPSLTGSLVDPIALPDLFGLQIQVGPGDITSVSNNTMIAIYANLGVAPATQTLSLEPLIGGVSVDYSKTLPSGLISPVVALNAAALRSDGVFQLALPVEWSYRVDHGFWSMWSTEKPEIQDPVFVLPGKHVVELRARYQGEPESRGRSVSQDVFIDWDAPQAELERVQDLMRVVATDLVDQDLEARFRLVGQGLAGQWTPWGQSHELSLAGRSLPALTRVDVEVRDDAGHITADTQTVRRAALTTTPRHTRGTPQTGCSSASSDPSVLGLLLVLGVFGLARRRRLGKAALLSVVMALSSCSCDDEDATSTAPCDPACGAGAYCEGGECIVGCDGDEDCVSSESCQNHQCQPRVNCPTGELVTCDDAGQCTCVPACPDGCRDGQFCCHVDNACQTIPDPCQEQVCEPGFGPTVLDAPAPDEETCEVAAGTCGCEELPPIDPGYTGSYLDIDQNAGVTAISAYNSTYGDFMIGVVSGTTPTFFYVDGVPTSGDIQGSLNGPRAGIKDRGPNVGTHTSVVVDDDGVIHAFYRSNETDSMWYARGTGAGTNWTFEVREFDVTKHSGYFPDAALLDGEVHVVYEVDNTDAAPGFKSVIRHASFAVGDATNALNVATEDIFEGSPSNPCGEKCASRMQCFPSQQQCLAPTADCGTCSDASACLNGACEPTYTIPPQSYKLAVGVFNELSVTPTGLLAVSWDGANNRVVAMRWDSGMRSWGLPQFTTGGPYASGLVAANGDLHLAYMDVAANTIVHRNVTANTSEVITQGVRDTSDGWMINDIGEDVQLRQEADGTFVVSYMDATRHTLHLARQSGTTWTTEELVGRDPYMGSNGFFATMLRAPDILLVAHFVINQQLMPGAGSVSVVAP